MSQNAGALTPSRGNRRFIILAIVLGMMGAGLVYVATSRTSDSGGGGGGSAADTPVVVAKADIPARTVVTQAMVEVKLVSGENAAPLAFTSVDQVVGQATRFPVTVGEQVLSSKVVTLSGSTAAVSRSLSFVIPEGRRAFAMNVEQVQTAGGLVLPGDYVDIIVMHDVQFRSADGGVETVENYVVQNLMQNVEVLAVSQAIVDVVETPSTTAANGSSGSSGASDTQRVRNSEARPEPDAITVTLALTPEEVQRMYLAEGNGTIRLAVRPYGDNETLPVDYQTKLELIPQDLPNPFQALR
jgi:pilus assembly protein CpaB